MGLPRFRRGGIIRAEDLNRIAAAAESGLDLPRAKDEPPPATQQGSNPLPADIVLTQAGTTTECVRIEDPDDPDTYVNVKRRTVETFTDQDGLLWRFVRSYATGLCDDS